MQRKYDALKEEINKRQGQDEKNNIEDEVEQNVEQKVKEEVEEEVEEVEEARKKEKEDVLKKVEEEVLKTEVDVDQQCQNSDGVGQEQNQNESGMFAEASLSASTDDSRVDESDGEQRMSG